MKLPLILAYRKELHFLELDSIESPNRQKSTSIFPMNQREATFRSRHCWKKRSFSGWLYSDKMRFELEIVLSSASVEGVLSMTTNKVVRELEVHLIGLNLKSRDVEDMDLRWVTFILDQRVNYHLSLSCWCYPYRFEFIVSCFLLKSQWDRI